MPDASGRGDPKLSPNGSASLSIAILIPEGMQTIWTYDSVRNVLTRFTFGQGDNMDPVWSPEGALSSERTRTHATLSQGQARTPVDLTRPDPTRPPEPVNIRGGRAPWSGRHASRLV